MCVCMCVCAPGFDSCVCEAINNHSWFRGRGAVVGQKCRVKLVQVNTRLFPTKVKVHLCTCTLEKDKAKMYTYISGPKATTFQRKIAASAGN